MLPSEAREIIGVLAKIRGRIGTKGSIVRALNHAIAYYEKKYL